MYEIRDMRKVKSKAVRMRRIKRKNALMALALMFAFVLGVAALQYSNLLSNTANLEAEYPLALSFYDTGEVGPFPANCFCYVTYAEDLWLENLNPDDPYNMLKMFFRVTLPAGGDASHINMVFEGSSVTFALVGGSYEATVSITTSGGIIAAGGTLQMTWSFEWLNNAPTGSYLIEMYAST